MKILITGGNGFIGHQVVKALESHHQLCILSRSPAQAREKLGTQHHYKNSLHDLSHLNDFDAVINLAGEPIANKRWSAHQKNTICQTRWQLTDRLSELIKLSQTPPSIFINASAIGIYGNIAEQRVDETLTLQEPNGTEDFPHLVCKQWEELALNASSEHTRVCVIRIGLVLGLSGGALPKMLPAFKLGLGGTIASGKQGMSWIHQEDVIALIDFLINNDTCSGIFNATAPHPVSNQEFSNTLASVLSRPSLLPMPAIILNILLGEMAQLLTQGQYVMPTRLIDAGYTFKYPQLSYALADILERK
ncbi:TIGR01777 family protein [Shewanella sp. VB17]|uniref:TIGR01777 family oxidoreductase n=1 Tax=Shewanella sp. VB17 TaxID=2739432 RepID=UPI0015656C95|nr:TIGR01777 family oxidoreductase [Shewanella sp. VB17]NRD73640.1 TIGR01777 family protein [Shewanella sp. VB17]